jgi:hypothetical protein
LDCFISSSVVTVSGPVSQTIPVGDLFLMGASLAGGELTDELKIPFENRKKLMFVPEAQDALRRYITRGKSASN